MLGFLKVYSDNSTPKKELQSNLLIVDLINGVKKYFKSLTFLNTVLPRLGKKQQEQQEQDDKDLFPKNIKYDNDLLKKTTAIPCSTTQQSKLSKVENNDGSITWKFEHDHTNNLNAMSFSNITSPFMTSTGSTVSSGDLSPSNNAHQLSNFQFMSHANANMLNSPSPISIESQQHLFHHQKPTHSDIDSTNSLDDDRIPDLPNPEFFDIKNRIRPMSTSPPQLSPQLSPQSSNEGKKLPSLSSSSSSSPSSSGKKVYTCEYCGSEFRIRGYLTRHIKKHALNKAYECPFYEEGSENKCHPNGGFSRRDTYKTHLKARHFKYPQGTKSSERASTPGKCGLCSQPFDSNEEWVEKHIESGVCEGLPKGYQIRAKNSRRKDYEFPNKDSPSSFHSTPEEGEEFHDHDQDPYNHEQKQHPQIQETRESSVQSITPTSQQIIMSSLKFNTGNKQSSLVNHDDYDDNDEYSLDVEQSLSYRPIRITDHQLY